MKKQTLLALSFCVIGLVTSCNTTKRTATTTSVAAQICQHPTVADLTVLPKMRTTVELPYAFLNFNQPSTIQWRENTVAELLEQQKADILLETSFESSRKLFGKRKLVVEGYPARFSNFRKASDEDLKELQTKAPAHKWKIYNVAQSWLKKVVPSKKH